MEVRFKILFQYVLGVTEKNHEDRRQDRVRPGQYSNWESRE
jgi:hypothetical protein